MRISYSTSRLEKILTNERLIKRHYTKQHIRLRNRISELRAAVSLADIPSDPPPRRHKLTGSLKGCWGIDISRNFRIIIKPQGSYDEHDLNTITDCLIIDIEDYH